jgi:hypothetical protein
MEKISTIEVTYEEAVNLALSRYLGEECKYCGKKYETLEDLSVTVWAGYHEKGRLACKKCWDVNNK